MSLGEEIADKLASLGLGVVGTSIFIGMLPDHPDELLAVMETGGSAPTFGFGVPGLKFETPNVQVIVRGARGDYSAPRFTIGLAYKGLSTVQGQYLGLTYYHMIKPIQSPFMLHRDQNERPVFIFNASCEKEIGPTPLLLEDMSGGLLLEDGSGLIVSEDT